MSLRHRIKKLAIFLLPVVLYLLPEELILSGNTICLSQRLFGLECWGCGITRAVYLVLHSDITVAMGYNRLVIVVLPILAVLWLQLLFERPKDPYSKYGLRRS